MNKLLRSDFFRMYHNKRIWVCNLGMIATALFFISMQYGAMDYTVSLDRVIFLPMTFYGIVIAALVSLFVGDDFSDGVIRNKLVAGRTRSSVYFSNLLCIWSACLMIYFLTTAATVGIGVHLFENNVTPEEFLCCLALGMFTCLAFGSIFCLLSILIGNKATSVMVCMGLAFVLLFLCLYTNQILVQQEYRNGALNPHYVGGIRHALYEWLHDMNPFGQVAQLSSMDYLNPMRWILIDFFWCVGASGIGIWLFQEKNIN